MTKRIFLGTFIVSLIATIAAAGLILGVFFAQTENSYTEQLMEEARLLAVTMDNTAPETDIETLAELTDFRNRITYIAADGTVLFDSEADPASMENHALREEISAAKSNGSGAAVRVSSTLSEKTIYCARELRDGCIVRVSGTQATVLSLLLGLWWEILLVLLVAAMVSFGLASVISRAIVKPINSIDLTEPDIDESYYEIAPLLRRIHEQNREISEQMAELKQSRSEFSLITENMSEGFIIADTRLKILSYNSSALHILGAQSISDSDSLLTLNRSEGLRKAVSSALSGKRAEQVLEMNDRFYQLFASPVSSEGEISGIVLIILDITEKEQREQLRREFTSNVSHELKTPLTTIYGISDMLVGGIVKSEDVVGFAKNIRDESGRLIALIQDIIKLSQLDEDVFPDRRTEVDLTELAHLVCERLRTAAEQCRVSLYVSGERITYVGIRPVLEEMMYNLLDNAVKYNREGGSAEIALSQDSDSVVIEVRDTGIGIPAESISRIFERFYRVDKSHSRKLGGTGLGLSIVKHGALLHGGNVQAQSVEGKGSVITIRLPKEKNS
ncbi:MAG: ATP-binding protein [Oscillospiraceae bacterium]